MPSTLPLLFKMTKTLTCGFVALSLLAWTADSASAQAWVGHPNSLSLSLDYNYVASDRVIEERGSEAAPVDDIRNHNIIIGAEYVPIERLAVSARIPIISTTYKGDPDNPVASFPRHGRYDDGSFHTVLQDFHLQARYMVKDGLFAISPHLAVTIPMTDYETVGYAGAGRGLRKAHLGVSVGKYFLSGLPGLFLHGQGEYVLAEGYKTGFDETSDYNQDYAKLGGMVGYFITPRLDIHLAADLHYSIDGFEFEDWLEVSQPVRDFHDPLLRERFFHIGGGISYQVIDGVRATLFGRKWLTGAQTRDADLLGVSVAWDVL